MMMYNAEQLKQALNIKHDLPDMLRAIQDELISFSNKSTVISMPLHLDFANAQGECHVKAGYTKHDDVFIIKIATGFYQNTALGLPAGDGLMLVCCKTTGMIKALLNDGGYLTTLRTALTACLAANLTPWPVDNINIIGTGALARLTIAIMHQHYPDARIACWGRNSTSCTKLQQDYPFVQHATDISQLVQQGGVVITTTASHVPLIYAKDITKKIHLIALGADQANKQEIDSNIFSMADRVMVDCKTQASQFGDSAVALQQKKLSLSDMIEIGCALNHTRLDKFGQSAHVMITDLTGIAAQDIGMAKYAMLALAQTAR